MFHHLQLFITQKKKLFLYSLSCSCIIFFVSFSDLCFIEVQKTRGRNHEIVLLLFSSWFKVLLITQPDDEWGKNIERLTTKTFCFVLRFETTGNPSRWLSTKKCWGFINIMQIKFLHSSLVWRSSGLLKGLSIIITFLLCN